jgi:hypothetical protein
MGTAVYNVHGAQENMRDLTTNLTYGWIARGRTRPRDTSYKGHIVQGTHHPKTIVRRHTSQGRIDPTVN